jgi:hypothetical protein
MLNVGYAEWEVGSRSGMVGHDPNKFPRRG